MSGPKGSGNDDFFLGIEGSGEGVIEDLFSATADHDFIYFVIDSVFSFEFAADGVSEFWYSCGGSIFCFSLLYSEDGTFLDGVWSIEVRFAGPEADDGLSRTREFACESIDGDGGRGFDESEVVCDDAHGSFDDAHGSFSFMRGVLL